MHNFVYSVLIFIVFNCVIGRIGVGISEEFLYTHIIVPGPYSFARYYGMSVCIFYEFPMVFTNSMSKVSFVPFSIVSFAVERY